MTRTIACIPNNQPSGIGLVCPARLARVLSVLPATFLGRDDIEWQVDGTLMGGATVETQQRILRVRADQDRASPAPRSLLHEGAPAAQTMRRLGRGTTGTLLRVRLAIAA